MEGRYQNAPLGSNLVVLKKRQDIDPQLLDTIEVFNQVAYVPSKHIYGPPNDPRHYFNKQDAIIIILAAVKLGEELEKIRIHTEIMPRPSASRTRNYHWN